MPACASPEDRVIEALETRLALVGLGTEQGSLLYSKGLVAMSL